MNKSKILSKLMIQQIKSSKSFVKPFFTSSGFQQKEQHHDHGQEKRNRHEGLNGCLVGFGAVLLGAGVLVYSKKQNRLMDSRIGQTINENHVKPCNLLGSTCIIDKAYFAGNNGFVAINDFGSNLLPLSCQNFVYHFAKKVKQNIFESCTVICSGSPRKAPLPDDAVHEEAIIIAPMPAVQGPVQAPPFVPVQHLFLHNYPSVMNSQLLIDSAIYQDPPWEYSSGLASIHFMHPEAARILLEQLALYDIPAEVTPGYIMDLLTATNLIYAARGMPLMNLDPINFASVNNRLMAEVNSGTQFSIVLDQFRNYQNHPWLVPLPHNYIPMFQYSGPIDREVDRIEKILSSNCGYYESGALHHLLNLTANFGPEIGGGRIFLHTLANYRINGQELDRTFLLFVLQRTLDNLGVAHILSEEDVRALIEEMMQEIEQHRGLWKLIQKLEEIQDGLEGNEPPQDLDW